MKLAHELTETRIVDGEKMTYAEYLEEYWSDEVTSPRCVEPRLWVKEVDTYEVYDEDFRDQFFISREDAEELAYGTGAEVYDTYETKYVVMTWGIGRYKAKVWDDNNGKGYDTEEEAMNYIYGRWDNAYCTLSHNVPSFD